MGRVDEHGLLNVYRALCKVYSGTRRRDIGRYTKKRLRDNQGCGEITSAVVWK